MIRIVKLSLEYIAVTINFFQVMDFPNGTSQLDDSNPGVGGCSQFPWTNYIQVPGSRDIDGE